MQIAGWLVGKTRGNLLDHSSISTSPSPSHFSLPHNCKRCINCPSIFFLPTIQGPGNYRWTIYLHFEVYCICYSECGLLYRNQSDTFYNSSSVHRGWLSLLFSFPVAFYFHFPSHSHSALSLVHWPMMPNASLRNSASSSISPCCSLHDLKRRTTICIIWNIRLIFYLH